MFDTFYELHQVRVFPERLFDRLKRHRRVGTALRQTPISCSLGSSTGLGWREK